MDFITIFQAILRWGIPAFIGGIVFFLLSIMIDLIYKKVFHGKKTFTKVQTISAVLLCCWLVLVIGLTSLSRGSNFAGSFNIDFLSGYISAWNHWSISELQLIIFNMLMFAPLGFLLPLLWKRAEKLWIILIVSLSLTSLIEVIQLLTGTGIFELDDLFHNLIGSLFGYFCIMAILTPIHEKVIRFAPIAKVLLIPCVISLILGMVFYAYDRQPYGNMSILPAVKQDMSTIQIVTKCKLSEQGNTATIYKNNYAEDKNYMHSIKSKLADLENLTFSKSDRRENENWVYTGTDTNGTAFQIIFFFRTGEWHYTTFTENTLQLTEETTEQLRNLYEKWMKKLNLLPNNAEFSIRNGDTLRWDVAPDKNLSKESKAFQQGSVMIQFDESGKLSSFLYQITWNTYTATENIISESEAYAQVEQGNFEQYVPFQPEDTLYVNSCELTYFYDTKGFYQPVYQFGGYINNIENSWACRIPAIAK